MSHGLQHPPGHLGQSKGFRKAGLGAGDTGDFHKNGNVKEEEGDPGSLENTGHLRAEEEGWPEEAKGRSLWSWGWN